MKNRILTTIITVCLIILFAGCQQSSQISEFGDRQAELIAAENRKLKKQIDQLNHNLSNQKQLVRQCLQEKKQQALDMQQSNKQLVEMTFKDLEENLNLKQKNEQLRNKVEALESSVN